MIGVVLLMSGILLILSAAVRTRSLALAVLAASLFVFYGIRAIGIALSLDGPHPSYLFTSTDIDSAMGRFGLLVLLFCVSVVVSHALSTDAAPCVARLLPLPRTWLQPGLVLMVTVAMTALAAVLALDQVVSHGGLDQAVYAAKSSRETGQALMRVPATLAIALSCATFYSAHRTTQGVAAARTIRLVAATCAAASALSASVWGSRQFVILAAAYLLGAPTIAAFRSAGRSWVVRAVLVFAIVIGVGFGLRVYRDDALGGETAVSQAQGNAFRQITISANGIALDSSLLAVKDWPRKHAWRDGEDFTSGLWGTVPAGWRPDQPAGDTVGTEFHRIYEPGANNGWPIGAPTEWYINFGWIGVILGGLLTGLFYRAITDGMRRSPMPELSTVATLILTLIVFPLGVSSSSPNRFVIHAVPLLLLIGIMSSLSGKQRESLGPAEPQLSPARHP